MIAAASWVCGDLVGDLVGGLAVSKKVKCPRARFKGLTYYCSACTCSLLLFLSPTIFIWRSRGWGSFNQADLVYVLIIGVPSFPHVAAVGGAWVHFYTLAASLLG